MFDLSSDRPYEHDDVSGDDDDDEGVGNNDDYASYAS